MSSKGDSITECELGHVIGETSAGIDTAWKFLDKHRDTHVAVDITALRRKIDWRIVPLMFCCYTMQFLDKVILNVRSPSMSQPQNVISYGDSTQRSWA